MSICPKMKSGHHWWGGQPLTDAMVEGDEPEPPPSALECRECGRLATTVERGVFTWKDVDLVRDQAHSTELMATPEVTPGSTDDDRYILRARALHLRDLADRIAALLPPREP